MHETFHLDQGFTNIGLVLAILLGSAGVGWAILIYRRWTRLPPGYAWLYNEKKMKKRHAERERRLAKLQKK